MIKGTIAARSRNVPPVDFLSHTSAELFNRVVSILHRKAYFRLVRLSQFAEGKLLAGGDANGAKSLALGGFFRHGRAELQQEIQERREVSLERSISEFWKIDRRGRCGRRLVQERRERRHFIALLDLFHVGHVRGIEELCAEDGERELRLGTKYLFDPVRCVAFPARSRDRVAASIGAGGAAPDVAIIERIHVGELHGVIAWLFNFWNA